jgi:hypothetical protein
MGHFAKINVTRDTNYVHTYADATKIVEENILW